MGFTVLFVCSGNQCRSPMAEGILKKLRQGGSEDISVCSAGTLGIDGAPASGKTIRVCRENGIDLRDHVSRGITSHIICTADLILCMEEHHRESVLDVSGDVRDKTFLLKEYSGCQSPFPIADPIGGTYEDYQACFREISEAMRNAFHRIVQHYNGNGGGV